LAILRMFSPFQVAFLSYAIFMTHSVTLEWQRRALIVLPVFALPACAVLLYKGLAKYFRMSELGCTHELRCSCMYGWSQIAWSQRVFKDLLASLAGRFVVDYYRQRF
jgi:hypothetical protein